VRARPESNTFPMRLSSPEKRSFTLKQAWWPIFFSTYFWPTMHPLFVQRVRKKTHVRKKVLARKALLMEMISRPREHEREEGLKSISSDASSICHKTSSKLFLVIDISHLVHCFKICFNYVLPIPMKSSVNWSNTHVFVRRNCMELWGNLRRWYLVNRHGDHILFILYFKTLHDR